MKLNSEAIFCRWGCMHSTAWGTSVCMHSHGMHLYMSVYVSYVSLWYVNAMYIQNSLIAFQLIHIQSFTYTCVLFQCRISVYSHYAQIEADELLPASFRRMLIKKPKRTIYFSDQKIDSEARIVHLMRWVSHFWGKVLKETWGVECWDSLDNIRECKRRFSEQLKKVSS